MRLRFIAVPVLVILIAAGCTYKRNNPCDVDGTNFNGDLFSEESREENFEMGWVKYAGWENCGFLMDKYEASRRDASSEDPGKDNNYNPRSLKGYMPWTKITFADAQASCSGKQGPYKRICKKSEFMAACQGGYVNEPDPTPEENQKQIYPYGNEYQKLFCNGAGFCDGKTDCVSSIITTGEAVNCYTTKGVEPPPKETAYPGLYDLSGNIAEWVLDDDTGLGVAIGGSYKSDATGLLCAAVDPTKIPTEVYLEVGFRCCK